MNWKQLVPKDEIDGRIQTLQARMGEAGIQAALVIQRVDLFYLTGTAQNAYLFIPANGVPLLMVKKYYPRAKQESPLEDVVEIRSVRDLPSTIEDHYGELPPSLGLEMDVLPFREFQFLKSIFSNQSITDISSLVLQCRAIKSTWEIEQLRAISPLSDKCFGVAFSLLRSHKDPIAIASDVQAEARRLGHGAKIRLRYHYEKALPFVVKTPCRTHVAPNLNNADCLVELDFKWVLNGYHLVEARLFKPTGLPSEQMRAAQDLAEIHKFIVRELRPEISGEELFRMAREKANSLRCGHRLAGMNMQDRPSRSAPLGHGIGLELREPPWISIDDKTRLRPNTVLCIRPALVLENTMAISMASVIRITKKGNEYLTKEPGIVLEKL